MGEVKGQGHIVYPVSNRCTTLSFHVNRTNHSWDMANRLFDFEKSKVKVTGEVKGQGHIIYPTDSLPFRFTSIGPTIPWDMVKRVLELEKYIRNFFLKFTEKKVSNRISPISNQVISMTNGVQLPSFVVIGWVVLILSCRQANLP